MNNLNKQLNKLLVVLVMISALSIVPTSQAKAGFLDWFSGTENRASVNQAFDSFDSFLSANNQAPNPESQEQNLPLLQNSSFVSSSLVTEVTKKKIEYAIIKSILTVPATAYSSTPDQTDSSPFITAWNTHVRDGIIAANFLPFGTKIKIPEIYGDKIFVVEDRMNRRYWHKIDIWFPDRASALEFGLKTVKIQILES